MQLFVCPVEVVVQFEKLHCRGGLKHGLLCLVKGAAILDEGREQDFKLSSDTKIHDEIEVGKPVCIQLAHGEVHLILLRFVLSKCLAFKEALFVA